MVIGTLAFNQYTDYTETGWLITIPISKLNVHLLWQRIDSLLPGYCFILAANFLLYFGFWLLIPVLPFYLSEFFQAGNSTIGIVLSCYTVAALCIRPFSGYLLDTFARKAALSFRLFHLYADVCGISYRRLAYPIYYIPNYSWSLFRHGHGRWKYSSH